MSSAIYDKARASFLNAEINITSDNLKVVLVVIGGGHYVVDLANDQFLSAISGGDRTALTANLSSKTTTAGVFNAANTLFSTVTGSASGAIVIYQDTGSAATSRLIAYIDDYAGLPVTPNGSDINIAWPTSTNKIFKL